MYACKGGHLDVVKYLHEAGSEELLMSIAKVSSSVLYGEYAHTLKSLYV
jgi:hypothetical protein